MVFVYKATLSYLIVTIRDRDSVHGDGDTEGERNGTGQIVEKLKTKRFCFQETEHVEANRQISVPHSGFPLKTK